MSSNKPIPFTFFKAHLADLLRNQAQHEYQNGGGEKKCAHVGKSAGGKKGIAIVGQSSQEKDHGDRKKNRVLSASVHEKGC